MTSSEDNDSTQQKILERAASDPEFRTRLLQDPRAAVGEVSGVPLPPNIGIRVVEEAPGEVVLVLPAQSRSAGAQLSDSDLENVSGAGDSGGDSWTGPCICW
jgi:hypothetical protein